MDTEFLYDQDIFIKCQKFGMGLPSFLLLSLVSAFLKTYNTQFLFFSIKPNSFTKMCSSNCSASNNCLQLFRIPADIMFLAVFCLCQTIILSP